MGSSLLRRLVVVSVILVVPAVGYAQEAALTGTVTDATMAVLPGVTIKAVHDGVGQHLRSRHRWTRCLSHSRARRRLQDHGASSPASAPSPATGVELLVGQTTTINLQMAPAAWPSR